MTDKPKEQVETAPDPDEDDLDDLDGKYFVTTHHQKQPLLSRTTQSNKPTPSPDVLDQFNAQPKPAANAPQPTSKPPPQQGGHGGLPKDDELAEQLQAGMQDLMGELDSNPEMQKEFERMMAELVRAGEAPNDAEAIDHIGKATEAVHLGEDVSAGASSSGAAAAGAGAGAGKRSNEQQQQQKSFQDTIRKTMERMQASGASADAAAASSGPSSAEDDMMAQLMKELQAGGAGGGGEEDFNKMLMGMMAQLTNKEILYEPMKELDDKFPAWMEKNKANTGKEDLARFEEQRTLVGEIVGRFERKGYSDENEDDREYIVERMQKVCCAAERGTDFKPRQMLTRCHTDASRGLAAARSSGRYECCSGSFGRS